MQTRIDEISQDIFRISTFVPGPNLQFNQFLIRDEEPVLIHTGLKGLFPLVREAVSRVMDPSRLRWIAFSHYEADECGSLNEWLSLAPAAAPLCSLVGALVSVNDVSIRPARPMSDDEVLPIGSKRLRFLGTPHLPHSWEAGLFFEESGKTLFTSDLFLHAGDQNPPLTDRSIMEQVRTALIEGEQGPFAHSIPYTSDTRSQLARLAALKPATLATMHGSSYQGDGEKALNELSVLWKKVLAPEVIR